MTLIYTIRLNCIALHGDKQAAHSVKVGALAPMFEKSTTEPKPNLLRHKNIVNIMTLNFAS